MIPHDNASIELCITVYGACLGWLPRALVGAQWHITW